MKIVKILIFLLISYGIAVFIKFTIDRNREVQYCGKVVKVYMTSAGYKVPVTRHIVFYNDSLKRNIDVRVTTQTFVNIVEGQRVCFDLDAMQLEE
jgi:hypothetical protein